MLQLILIVKLVTCEMHSKIKFFNQKPTNEIGRPHYTPLVYMGKMSFFHTCFCDKARENEERYRRKGSTISINFHNKNLKLWGSKSPRFQIVVALTNFHLAGVISTLEGIKPPKNCVIYL